MNANQSRYKGKFCKSNVVRWKNKVIKSNKTRHDLPKPIELVGRRLIDLQTLINDLWCYRCKKVLSLRDSYEESRNGLASIFKVKCTSCNKIFKVNTSATEPDTITSIRPTYTVNSKIVSGAIESGTGNTHLNKILSAVNVPIMHTSVFKRYEKKVGAAIEELAKESCLENLKLEREMTIEKECLRSNKLE
ncbi:PREDICTED: uncharacterized protein LOC108769013 [Trachymyrmex cornetzi]|nr:PREDICTED: uncharacterized protein LOC108769013 [Trachymyrmex cornetzi]